MDRGDERAALRAEAKYRRIDIKAEKNIYDYSPNDPDPTIDYYFEPLSPEEQAKFDQEDRRQYCLKDGEAVTNGSANPPTPNGTTDSPAPIKQAAELHGIPILPKPLRRQEQEAHHPQPITSKSLSLWERARVRVNPYPSSPSMPAPSCLQECYNFQAFRWNLYQRITLLERDEWQNQAAGSS